MGKADAAAMARGVPGTTLMEAAGKAVAQLVMRSYRRRPAVMLCGPGNNGGDGLVAARHLQAAGWPVRVGLLASRDALRGDAAWAATSWRGPIEPLSVGLLDGQPLVIDALFGAGLSRPIDGVAGEAIDRMNREALSVVAVDVPSGLHGDSGEIMGRAPHAEHTVTFFRPKPAHCSLAGLERCGALSVVDIGIPPDVLHEIAPRLWLNAPALWRHHLRRRALDVHKYARGHLTILGGPLATGATRMAALAARRAGAGLVSIAAPQTALVAYQSAEPGNLVAPSDDPAAFASLLEDPRRNVALIGPGAGISERTRCAVLDSLAARKPVLLDADAISCFAAAPQSLFDAICGPALLTPHEGEFRRLFPDLGGVTDKVERTRTAARRSGATVLLKGPDTVVAAADGRAVVNVHASPALATAGSGDVLAGIAGGLMAQGFSPLAAGSAAAWLHGESARRFAMPGLVAEDLIVTLPAALQAAAGID